MKRRSYNMDGLLVFYRSFTWKGTSFPRDCNNRSFKKRKLSIASGLIDLDAVLKRAEKQIDWKVN